MDNNNFLTAREVADQLGVHRNTVYNYISMGLIKIVKIGPRNILIPKAELDKLLTPVTKGK